MYVSQQLDRTESTKEMNAFQELDWTEMAQVEGGFGPIKYAIAYVANQIIHDADAAIAAQWQCTCKSI